MGLINFDFMNLRCSPNNRQKLAKIYRADQEGACKKAAEGRLRLLNVISSSAYDPVRGIYTPLSDTIYLTGQLQQPLTVPPGMTPPLTSHFYTYFTNPLLVPEGYDERGFDLGNAVAPIDRLTNAGWIVITMEFDWDDVGAFDRNLDWFSGTNGNFNRSPFAELDKALGRHRDYRGFCAVYSGRRSVHTHFLYDTTHLKNAPHDADWRTRIAHRSESAALMMNVHKVAWDHARSCVCDILQPGKEPDRSLAAANHWRRAPYGINHLQKDCDFLDLSKGQAVPQIVIHENIRHRSVKNSNEWLIDPLISAPRARPTRSKRNNKSNVSSSQITDHVLEIMREACATEWEAPYPRPMKIDIQGGDVAIHFANSDSDRNPSTIVKGAFRKLLLFGKDAPTCDLYLPGDFTASEFVAWATQTADEKSLQSEATSLTRSERNEVIIRERRKIGEVTELYHAPVGSDRLITSVEGAGKTTSLLLSMNQEMLDRHMDSKSKAQHFMCYAARSRKQAVEKQREYEIASGGSSVVLESFWAVYADMCAQAGLTPIPRGGFSSRSISEALATIKKKQSKVFDLLERYRLGFWKNASFICGITMIFTTKATICTWHSSVMTRAWLHPKFKHGIDSTQEKKLADDFGLGIVAFDELELDEFVHIWPEAYYQVIDALQNAHPKWRGIPYHERQKIYETARFQHSSLIPDFDQFDADMRVKLSDLDRVAVDFDAAPFGNDATEQGIYREKQGKVFYLGAQKWLSYGIGSRNFLTTERLMTEVVRAVYRKKIPKKSRLWCKQIDPPTELFPLEVDLFLDKRASTRKSEQLASEILDANPNACVISNGVKIKDDHILTFQKAKGANHLSDNDVYIIVTHLNPDHYAQLNVIGQWLGIPDVIELYYRDLVSQAVGRNAGFRDNGNNRKTIVVASRKLLASGIFVPSKAIDSEPSANDVRSEIIREICGQELEMMGESEFSPRSMRPDRLHFRAISTRPW